MESPFYTLIGGQHRLLLREYFSADDDRYVMPFPKTMDELWTSLHSTQRSKLRRKYQRVWRHFAGRIQIREFSSMADLEPALAVVEQIASQSDKRSLGFGFFDTPEVREGMALAAMADWLKIYVLYLEDKPAAFWMGTLYNGCLQADHVAHDRVCGAIFSGHVSAAAHHGSAAESSHQLSRYRPGAGPAKGVPRRSAPTRSPRPDLRFHGHRNPTQTVVSQRPSRHGAMAVAVLSRMGAVVTNAAGAPPAKPSALADNLKSLLQTPPAPPDPCPISPSNPRLICCDTQMPKVSSAHSLGAPITLPIRTLSATSPMNNLECRNEMPFC